MWEFVCTWVSVRCASVSVCVCVCVCVCVLESQAKVNWGFPALRWGGLGSVVDGGTREDLLNY